MAAIADTSKRVGEHAIVIGGGIAGLLAARVLTHHFERVTLIERDHFPTDPVFRPGVPQGRHVHVLLTQGQRLLEEFFPGITAKLKAQGAIELDFNKDIFYYFWSGLALNTPSQLRGVTCSRILLEWQVRQELLHFSGVKCIEGHEVTGLTASKDKQKVTGIRMRERSTNPTAEDGFIELAADLVVDASGRTSNAPQWLKTLDYEAPTETVVNAFLGYATRSYTPPVDLQHTWKGITIGTQSPGNPRGGVIWTVEGGYWMVVLAGEGKVYPPTDEEGFLEFAKKLPFPVIYEAIKDAAPLTPIYGYRRTENRLRHFEQMPRQPEGFIAIGDAYCAFNPVYGQGMTVAALEAQTLATCLSRQHATTLATFPSQFYRQLARVTALPWQLAAASDQRVPGCEGGEKTGKLTQLQNRYFDAIFALFSSDKTITMQFLEVLHLVRAPITLFYPRIAWKVLTRGLSLLKRYEQTNLQQSKE